MTWLLLSMVIDILVVAWMATEGMVGLHHNIPEVLVPREWKPRPGKKDPIVRDPVHGRLYVIRGGK